MNSIIKALVAIGFSATASAAVQAQSLILGAGYSDFSDNQANDQATVSLEYQHRPFYEASRFSSMLGSAVSVTADGDTFAGVGIVGTYRVNNRWFFEGSVLPGYYSADNTSNDLGGNFQIRTLIGIGYIIGGNRKVSLAITHKSNASTHEDNPGVNTAYIRYHFGF